MTESSSTHESLLHEFEQLGLSPYEARVLLALVRLGPANTAQLARHSRVPRTSTYQVLEELSSKGLAQRLSVEGPAVWAAPDREELFDRLDAAQEERLRQHRARTARLRETLAKTFPDAARAPLPCAEVLQGAAHSITTYDRLLAKVEHDLLVLDAPPYAFPDGVKRGVLDAARRGVRARVLAQAPPRGDRSAEAVATMLERYRDGGVDARVVDDVPVKIVVADRRVVLVALAALDDSGHPQQLPTTVLVEHPGFAELQAAAFERLWDSAEHLSDGPSPARAGASPPSTG